VKKRGERGVRMEMELFCSEYFRKSSSYFLYLRAPLVDIFWKYMLVNSPPFIYIILSPSEHPGPPSVYQKFIRDRTCTLYRLVIVFLQKPKSVFHLIHVCLPAVTQCMASIVEECGAPCGCLTSQAITRRTPGFGCKVPQVPV